MASQKSRTDASEGITKPVIRRIMRRGGVKRTGGACYEETRSELETFMRNILRDSITYTGHGRRKTVSSGDVVASLKRAGRALYGFDDSLLHGQPTRKKKGRQTPTAKSSPPAPVPAPQETDEWVRERDQKEATLLPGWHAQNDTGQLYYYKHGETGGTWDPPSMTGPPDSILDHIALDTVLLLLQDWFGLDETFVKILSEAPLGHRRKADPRAIQKDDCIFKHLLTIKPEETSWFTVAWRKQLAARVRDLKENHKLFFRFRISQQIGNYAHYHGVIVKKQDSGTTVQILNSAEADLTDGDTIYAARETHRTIFNNLGSTTVHHGLTTGNHTFCALWSVYLLVPGYLGGPKKPGVDELFTFVRNVMRDEDLKKSFIDHCELLAAQVSAYKNLAVSGEKIAAWILHGGLTAQAFNNNTSA